MRPSTSPRFLILVSIAAFVAVAASYALSNDWAGTGPVQRATSAGDTLWCSGVADTLTAAEKRVGQDDFRSYGGAVLWSEAAFSFKRIDYRTDVSADASTDTYRALQVDTDSTDVDVSPYAWVEVNPCIGFVITSMDSTVQMRGLTR